MEGVAYLFECRRQLKKLNTIAEMCRSIDVSVPREVQAQIQMFSELTVSIIVPCLICGNEVSVSYEIDSTRIPITSVCDRH